MLVSYIVPLYNYADYVADCLDSLLRQGLSEDQYEVLVIDDGSTDKGPQIVQGYCDRHSCIKLIRQENQGAGIARNTGLDAAQGDFVIYVDADDWLADDGIGNIFRSVIKSDTDIDIIFFGYSNVTSLDNATSKTDDINIEMKGSLLDYATHYGIMTVCWRTIFRRTILNGYRFKDYPISEDMDYMLNVYSNHPDARVVSVNNRIYNYRQQSQSIMHSTDPQKMARSIVAYSKLYEPAHQLLDPVYPKETVDTFVMLHIQFAAIVRLLSGGFLLGEYKSLLNMCRNSGMFPIENTPTRTMKMASLLSRSPFLLWMLSPLYRNLYLKYLKK